MPELPEVETALRGIRPHLEGRRIERLTVRNPRLRLPIPPDLAARLAGEPILGLSRRAKYLLIELGRGSLILHLGMSGSLRVLPAETPPLTHDHLDLVLSDGHCLRLHDPRRFGLFLWTPDPPDLARARHPLLRDLGPEPLEDGFDGDLLYRLAQGRRVAVKSFVMDGSVVVGVGNIYANESLHLAGIHPARGLQPHRSRPLSATCRHHPLGPGGRHRPGRHHTPGLREGRRQPGLFCPVAASLRPYRGALPELRGPGAGATHRPALQLLLPALSALTIGASGSDIGAPLLHSTADLVYLVACASRISVSLEGRRHPVRRPDFKSGWGRQAVLGGFDSHALPPQVHASPKFQRENKKIACESDD